MSATWLGNSCGVSVSDVSSYRSPRCSLTAVPIVPSAPVTRTRRAAIPYEPAFCIAASNAISDGEKSVLRTNASASRRAPVAVHAAVLPFDRERALVADPVQRAEEVLEVDVAVAGRDEVPAARLLAEVQVRGEDRAASVEPLLRVLDVHVVDPVGEVERELRGVEELVREVARVEVDPERLAVVDRVQRLPRRDEVVRDLGRVHLEAELDALLVEDVHDRAPPLGEVLVARSISSKSLGGNE